MDSDTSIQELAVAKSQMLASAGRIAGSDGLREQAKANRGELGERVTGAAFALLLIAAPPLYDSDYFIHAVVVAGFFAAAFLGLRLKRKAEIQYRREIQVHESQTSTGATRVV
jgi:hypothetical protein